MKKSRFVKEHLLRNAKHTVRGGWGVQNPENFADKQYIKYRQRHSMFGISEQVFLHESGLFHSKTWDFLVPVDLA